MASVARSFGSLSLFSTCLGSIYRNCIGFMSRVLNEFLRKFFDFLLSWALFFEHFGNKCALGANLGRFEPSTLGVFKTYLGFWEPTCAFWSQSELGIVSTVLGGFGG